MDIRRHTHSLQPIALRPVTPLFTSRGQHIHNNLGSSLSSCSAVVVEGPNPRNFNSDIASLVPPLSALRGISLPVLPFLSCEVDFSFDVVQYRWFLSSFQPTKAEASEAAFVSASHGGHEKIEVASSSTSNSFSCPTP